MRCAALIGAGLLAAACGPSSKSGACKDTIGPGDLVITEVFADFKAPTGSSGADTGKEWFEIYNASDRPIELEGLTITHSRQDGSKANTHTMTNVTVAPGQYFTLGDSTQDLVAPYVDYGYGADLGDFYNTDGGKLALSCGDTEIDSAGYDTVKEGHARELTAALPPDYTVNDDLASWCQAEDTEFEDGNFGTPGADNDCVPVVVGQCNDAGTMRATMPPGVGDLVITEIMPKPHAVSATVGQWFEVRATKDVDLNGIGLDRANDNNVAPQEVASGDCIHLATGDYAVFARSGDMAMNGGIAAAGTFSFSLNPTANPDVQIVYGGTIIDAVTWTTSTTGKSLNLDPDFVDSASNDDPSNFCDGATIYNTVGANSDLGTPRADNTQCVAQPGPGECLDAGTPRAIVKPTAGQLVISEFMANPASTGTDAAMEWFEIVNTGAAAFDLNDLTVKGNTTMSDVHATDCKSVAAGAYALFAHSIDPLTNGGLPDVDATFTTALAQSNGSLSILDGATVIDAITWTTGIVDGASKQLQPAMLDAVANDTPANFCNAAAAQTYGTAANLGTPKAVNVCM